MPYRTIKLEIEADLATLTLNRPDQRNAISPEMIEEFLGAFDEVESGPAGVVLLTGAGKGFCSGMDLDALRAISAQSSEQSLESSRRMAQMFRRIYNFPKPLLAAVNGPAIAGGCGIATLCDFTLAVPEAKFGYTEVRIGFVPAIVSVFLIRQIGEKRARDLLLTGRLFSAEEASQLGLVNEVVPPHKLLERARELAGQLLEVSPTSVTYTKRLLRELTDAGLDHDIERAVHTNAAIRSTADFREGLSAFLQKRKPTWRRVPKAQRPV